MPCLARIRIKPVSCPVLLRALRRLASMCLREVIENRLNSWVRFVSWPRLSPEILGDRQRIDIALDPPRFLIADLVQLPVMSAAKWHRELIADFQAHGSGLSKS